MFCVPFVKIYHPSETVCKYYADCIWIRFNNKMFSLGWYLNCTNCLKVPLHQNLGDYSTTNMIETSVLLL